MSKINVDKYRERAEKETEPFSFIADSYKSAQNFIFDMVKPYGVHVVTTRSYGKYKNKVWVSREDDQDKLPFMIEAVRQEMFVHSWKITIYPKGTKPLTEEELKIKTWKDKWLTKEVLDAFRRQGDTSAKMAHDIQIIAKFFTPSAGATWYCYEYDEENEIFWCFANLGDVRFAECGTVSLHELATFRGMFNLGVERDRYFGPATLASVQKQNELHSA